MSSSEVWLAFILLGIGLAVLDKQFKELNRKLDILIERRGEKYP
jgi:hypothetical protein